MATRSGFPCCHVWMPGQKWLGASPVATLLKYMQIRWKCLVQPTNLPHFASLCTTEGHLSSSSGKKAWQWNISGKITYFDGPFPSKPCLMKPEGISKLKRAGMTSRADSERHRGPWLRWSTGIFLHKSYQTLRPLVEHYRYYRLLIKTQYLRSFKCEIWCTWSVEAELWPTCSGGQTSGKWWSRRSVDTMK